MDCWGSLPDEVIIRVLLSLIDDPRPILVFAQTSKRHNAIATDDAVWRPITAYIFKWFGVPSIHVNEDVLRQHRGRILTHTQPYRAAFHQLYVRFFGPYRWSLGWWIVQGGAASDLCRVYARFAPDAADGWVCSIVGHPVVTAFNQYELPEELHPAVQYEYSLDHEDGSYFVSLLDHPDGGISIYGHNTARIEYPQDYPHHDEWLFEIQALEDKDEEPISQRAHCGSQWGVSTKSTLFPPVETSPWAEVNLSSLSGRLLDSITTYNDAPFPSPSSTFVIPGVQHDPTTRLPIVPRATWHWLGTEFTNYFRLSATPIHSPSYYLPETDDLLTTGIYMTPGAAARRFVLLQTRSLTEADFVESWPWEGHFGSSSRGMEQLKDTARSLDWADPDVHLGPFSAIRCTGLIPRFPRLTSEEHVRPGARIVEITKLAGQGASPGQRTIVAFLQDPLVPSELLAEVQAGLPASYRDLPEEQRTSPPWPISRKAMADPSVPETTASILQTPFEPERGIDLPAVGRAARDGFIKPGWLDVIVHVESRDRFTVYWQDINYVEVFTKMNDI